MIRTLKAFTLHPASVSEGLVFSTMSLLFAMVAGGFFGDNIRHQFRPKKLVFAGSPVRLPA